MGIFSKKAPCPICGGKISFFLPTKIDGEHICDDCSKKIDIQDELKNNLTIHDFKEYIQFYEENLHLKESFVVSQKIDFGVLDTKIIFDLENKLFCMSKNPDKTVFEGVNLQSFTIKEDSALLFEGSHDGLKMFTSAIPDRVMALAPQIAQFMMNKQLVNAIDKLDDDDDNKNTYHRNLDIPEPFRSFNVELVLNHPYWKVIKCDMSGPTFSNDYPDTNDYLNDYRRSIEVVEQLARAFMEVAFPGTGEFSANAATMAATMAAPVAYQTAAPVDNIEEIKKYKALMEEGIITREEFDAKKKKLLGI